MTITYNKCVIAESAFQNLKQLPIETLNMYPWYYVHTLISQTLQNEAQSFAKFHFFEYLLGYFLQVVESGYVKNK